MIDPDRVMKMAYLPGERVRAELGFDWEGEITAVTAYFRDLKTTSPTSQPAGSGS